MTKTSEVVEVKVGDIFVSSWGYDQTNVQFYEVVGLTKTKKSARLRGIAQLLEDEGDGWEMVIPSQGAFMGDVFTKRVISATSEPCFRICSFEYAFRWNGTPKHQTGPYAGH